MLKRVVNWKTNEFYGIFISTDQHLLQLTLFQKATAISKQSDDSFYVCVTLLLSWCIYISFEYVYFPCLNIYIFYLLIVAACYLSIEIFILVTKTLHKKQCTMNYCCRRNKINTTVFFKYLENESSSQPGVFSIRNRNVGGNTPTPNSLRSQIFKGPWETRT